MKIERKYRRSTRNATVLLRPKTGLKDMVVELNPGTQTAGAAPAGCTDPDRPDAARRQPRRDPLLAGHRHARLPAAAASAPRARGSTARASRLSAALRRFEPTGALPAPGSTARWPCASATSAASIHNFACSRRRLGAKDDDLAALRRLVQRGLQALRRPGREPARGAAGAARGPRRDATRRWPRSTKLAQRARADARGAAARRARARAVAASRRARSCTETTPIIKNQLRPFARAALPMVTDLRPAARDLAAVTPDLTTSFRSLNYLLNTLAYNPPGKEEGYLFWASWANHDGATVFSTQDAHGPIRHGLVLASCSTLQVLHQLSGPGRSSARSARCSTRPTRTSCALGRPARRGRRRRSRARPPRRCRRRRCRCAARGGPADAEAGSQPRPHPRRWSASRCRASACCCSCGSRSAARSRCKPKGYRFNIVVPRGRQLSPEADVRISGVPVGKVKVIKRRQADRRARTRRSSSIRSTRRCPGRAGRSCARRRCWARPTSS